METKCREPQAMQKWRLNGRNVLKKHRFRTFKRYFLHLFTSYSRIIIEMRAIFAHSIHSPYMNASYMLKNSIPTPIAAKYWKAT